MAPRRFSFPAEPPDAAACLATLATFSCVADYEGFAPEYDEERRLIFWHLDLEKVEEGCAERAVVTELEKVVSEHRPRVARPSLRR